jgi:hypothetical protein
MRKLSAVTILALYLSGSASADELLWAGRYMLGLTTISIAQNGTLYCTGCNVHNFYDRGPIPIQRGPGVDAFLIRLMYPYMSTSGVVLFHVPGGSHCAGSFYTISLGTHLLERVDTTSFACNEVNISVTSGEQSGMVMTLTDRQGHREVREVR